MEAQTYEEFWFDIDARPFSTGEEPITRENVETVLYYMIVLTALGGKRNSMATNLGYRICTADVSDGYKASAISELSKCKPSA